MSRPTNTASAYRRPIRLARRPKVPAAGPVARSAFESLERRTLFASIIVTSAADSVANDMQVTLREAIQAAETNLSVDGSTAGSPMGTDTITFVPALTAGGDLTINLTLFDTGLDAGEVGPTAFAIAGETQIVGPTGANGITIARAVMTPAFRLFDVRATGRLTIENLTLSNGAAVGFAGDGGGGGSAGLGGAVYNRGGLILVASTLSGNSAVGGAGGNGISMAGGGGAGLGEGSPALGAGGGPNGGAAGTPMTNATAGGYGGGGGAGGAANMSGNGGAGGFGGGGGAGSGPVGSGFGGAGGFGGGGGGGGAGLLSFGSGGAGGFGGGPGGSGFVDPMFINPSLPGAGGGGAGLGGAVFNDGGEVYAINATFAGNAATGGAAAGSGNAPAAGQGHGGAIFSRNGVVGTLNATIAGNSASTGGSAAGIVALSDGAGQSVSLALYNTIVANSGPGMAIDVVVGSTPGSGMPIVAGNNNLVEFSSGVPMGVISQTDDPQLGMLADNGGPTPTFLPALTSPAVDNGDNDAPAAFTIPLLPTDQRGEARISPAGGTTDIGAVEVVQAVPPPPVVPELSVSDVTVAEGNAGAAFATFTITLSAAAAGNVTVDYATANGTAGSPSDYLPIAGTHTFAPGQLTKTVSVAVVGDTTVEATELFLLNLSNAAGATIDDNQGVGTITNDDVPPPPPPSSYKVNDVTRLEGNAGTTSFVFTVTRTGNVSAAGSVKYNTQAISALSGVDYTGATVTTLAFAAGQSTRQVTVAVKGDAQYEQDDVFLLKLSGATNGATISDASGSGTILNDDLRPTLTVNDVSKNEGSGGGTTAFTFTLTLSAASDRAVILSYATAAGTAGASDFTAAAGTVVFAPGQTSKTVTVLVKADGTAEAAETFFLDLSNVDGANLGDGQGKGTIKNDD